MAFNNHEITYGEAEQFFATLMSSETPKARKYYVYGTYKRALEDENRTAEFEKFASGEKNYGAWRYFGMMIGKDMCVATWTANGETKGYIPMYKNSEGKILGGREAFLTFDDAVLACVALKNTGKTDSVNWMKKLMASEI